MPKLWDETIEAHRRAVRDKTLDTTAALVHEYGLSVVTMSQIAKATGIGRATLYKYFPDVESIMIAWHERQITVHLATLAEVRAHASASTPRDRLSAVLGAYARLSREHEGNELAALLHRADHVARAQEHLRGFLRDLLHEGAAAGVIRDDVPADELVSYCLHALTAAGRLPGTDSVDRLVQVTLDGLRPRGTADNGASPADHPEPDHTQAGSAHTPPPHTPPPHTPPPHTGPLHPGGSGHPGPAHSRPAHH